MRVRGIENENDDFDMETSADSSKHRVIKITNDQNPLKRKFDDIFYVDDTFISNVYQDDEILKFLSCDHLARGTVCCLGSNQI